MSDTNLNSNDSSLAVDLQEATQALKESRFADALRLLEINLTDHPNNIDALYLSAVSCRYLKKVKEANDFLERLLIIAPDMGRAYQELGHLNKSINNDDKAINSYR